MKKLWQYVKAFLSDTRTSWTDRWTDRFINIAHQCADVRWKVWNKPLSEDVFWQRIEFYWVKTYNGEGDSSCICITDSCSGCGRLYSAHHTSKVNKVEDLARYFDQCLYPSKLHLLSKISFQAFFYVLFFTHIHLTRWLSSMVYHLFINIIAVTTLLLTSGLHRC